MAADKLLVLPALMIGARSLSGSGPERLFSNSSRQRHLLATDGTTTNSVCVEYAPEGYYSSQNGALTAGLPSSSYTFRPATISACELERLHQDCVDRINLYRSGVLKFSDGAADSNVVDGLQPLAQASGSNECSSSQAMGDLLVNVNGGGGCSGAHHTAGTCDSSGGWAQNSCCGAGAGNWGQWDTAVYDTYEEVRENLYECLQSMWDEGMPECVDDDQCVTGHWETMRSTTHPYSTAHCGFAFTTDGRVFMNQDFTVGFVEPVCSCEGKAAGASDGCGGTCVGCTEADPPVRRAG